MRLKTITVVGFSLFVLTLGAPANDWSFEKMCKFYKGRYEARQNSASGDICNLDFPTATTSKDEAELFCNTFVPYHIIEAQPGKRTQCKAEATLICDTNWVQMYGRCYKITRKQMKYQDAKKLCDGQVNSDNKPLKASIAFLHREQLIGRWIDYFQKVNRFWLDASEVYTEKLYYNRGPNMLLAMDGHRYRVKSNWLVRVPDTETAMVLCEYTPPMNKAESNYLIKRYDEIYYPSISTEEGVSVRSASSRNRDDNDRLADSKYCQKVLSPFLRSVGAQSAIPTEAFVKALTGKTSMMLIRTSVYSHDSSKSNRIDPKCSGSVAMNYGISIVADDSSTIFRKANNVWRKGFPKETCDGGSWSTGVVVGRTETGLEDMSDARSAPIYCQTRFESQSYADCKGGYTAYVRKNGQKWCHKFRAERMSHKHAVEHCAKEGSFLTGFTDEAELSLLNDLAGQSVAKFEEYKNIWLGAERRQQCRGTDRPFDYNPDSPCSLQRVFEWRNAVAPNPPMLGGKWMRSEPSAKAFSKAENCLTLVKGYIINPTWLLAYSYVEKKFNDVSCEDEGREEHYPFCGHEAPIVLKTLDT